MTVYERLAACGSEKYRDFQSKLVPNIPADTILGVKTPDMSNIAKEIKGTKEAEEFLREEPLHITPYAQNSAQSSGLTTLQKNRARDISP